MEHKWDDEKETALVRVLADLLPSETLRAIERTSSETNFRWSDVISVALGSTDWHLIGSAMTTSDVEKPQAPLHEESREHDLNPNRYGEGDSRPFFLNWEPYKEAHKAIATFFDGQDQSSPTSDGDREASTGVTVNELAIPEENRLLPVDGYFCFFSDLLGFSEEVSMGGMDSLPDYYGAAFVAAGQNPSVQVYMLSDSCIAFAPVDEADAFVEFIPGIVSNWLADGLIPQVIIGYGSFVERRPFASAQPPNFFGTQITGTALSDAVNLQKTKQPLGSRILLTEAAVSHWPVKYQERIAQNGNGDHEVMLQRAQGRALFDCLYYLLCLREHALDTRPFDHYIWSFASRAVEGGVGIPALAAELAVPYYKDCEETYVETIIDRIKRVLEFYPPVS